MKNETTITAISTPVGVGGISVIRLSGKNSKNIASNVFPMPLSVFRRIMALSLPIV